MKSDDGNAALRYLWARERIKYLDYMVDGPEDSPEAKAILALGLKYNLMTNYTSFIAIDEQVVNKDGKQTTARQPIPLPEGVSDYAVGHETANLKMSGASRAVGGVLLEEEEIEEEIYMVVESDPEFPGGMDSLYAFIQRNLVYPQQAKEQGVEGTVIVSFTVEKDGSISNLKVLRDIGGGCGAEAVRVLMKMPKWKPGKQRGVAVRTQFHLPIKFNLRSKQ